MLVKMKTPEEILRTVSEEEIEVYNRNSCLFSSVERFFNRVRNNNTYYKNTYFEVFEFQGDNDKNEHYYRITGEGLGTEEVIKVSPFCSFVPKKYVTLKTKQLEIDFD
jgi:hypothetical protein